MGRCKQLLPLGERSALACGIETLLAAGLEEIVVVIGPAAAEVEAEARRFPARVAVNPASGSDMAASLQVGLAALSPGTTHVVVALCDHPLVAAATVATLLEEQQAHPEAIVVPTWGGRKGHPVLLPRKLLEELPRFPTLRDLLRVHAASVHCVEVDDEAVVLDMDTPADYARLLQRSLERAG